MQDKSDDWMHRHGWVRNKDGEWIYRQIVKHAITAADGAGER